MKWKLLFRVQGLGFIPKAILYLLKGDFSASLRRRKELLHPCGMMRLPGLLMRNLT